MAQDLTVLVDRIGFSAESMVVDVTLKQYSLKPADCVYVN